MPRPNEVKDLSGQKFGRLTVLARDFSRSETAWLCQCDCGNQKVQTSVSLRHGNVRSCGCLRNEKAREHGFKTKNPCPFSFPSQSQPGRLWELYWQQHRSVSDIAHMASDLIGRPVSNETVRHWLVDAGITRRSYKEAQRVVHHRKISVYRKTIREAISARAEKIAKGELRAPAPVWMHTKKCHARATATARTRREQESLIKQRADEAAELAEWQKRMGITP